MNQSVHPGSFRHADSGRITFILVYCFNRITGYKQKPRVIRDFCRKKWELGQKSVLPSAFAVDFLLVQPSLICLQAWLRF